MTLVVTLTDLLVESVSPEPQLPLQMACGKRHKDLQSGQHRTPLDACRAEGELAKPDATVQPSFSFFSATMLLFPPAWQAVQLPLKMASPFSRSAAKAGRLPTTAASKPRAAPRASGLKAAVVDSASGAAAPAERPVETCTSGALLGVLPGSTKQLAPRSRAAPATKATRDIFRD